jgi:endonuclease/exonuclease/phosphatase family metal-dependent hydrolase
VIYSITAILSVVVGAFFLLKIINRCAYGARSTGGKYDRFEAVDTVRILSFNAFWRPNIIRLGKNEWAKERAAILLSKVVDYDIVVLSECYSFMGSPISSFIKSMNAKGFIYIARTPPVPVFLPAIVDGGLIIFSRFPITANETTTFDLSYGIDTWISKGFVYAKILTGPGTHIHVFAIHPQANYKDNLLGCEAVRFAQLRQMMAVVRRRAMDGQPIFVIGDLNVDALQDESKRKRSVSEYNRLIQTLTFQMDYYRLEDCLLESLGEHPVTFGEDEVAFTKVFDRGSRQSLDYIFVYNREDGEYNVEGQVASVRKFEVEGHKFTHLSDHYGVDATVKLARVKHADL